MDKTIPAILAVLILVGFGLSIYFLVRAVLRHLRRQAEKLVDMRAQKAKNTAILEQMNQRELMLDKELLLQKEKRAAQEDTRKRDEPSLETKATEQKPEDSSDSFKPYVVINAENHPAQRVKCVQCGASIDDGARFCKFCGTSVPDNTFRAEIVVEDRTKSKQIELEKERNKKLLNRFADANKSMAQRVSAQAELKKASNEIRLAELRVKAAEEERKQAEYRRRALRFDTVFWVFVGIFTIIMLIIVSNSLKK